MFPRPPDWGDIEILSEEWNQPGDPALGKSPFGYKTTVRSVDPDWVWMRYIAHIEAATKGAM